MSEVTVDQLQSLCAEVFAKRAKYEEQKQISSALNAEYEAAEQKLVEILQLAELSSFKSNHGTVSIRKKEYYPVPKDSEQKQQIRKYMEDRGIFEDSWSIHSSKYNAWMKAELEVAKEEKRFLDIPGAAAPTISFDLVMKKS